MRVFELFGCACDIVRVDGCEHLVGGELCRELAIEALLYLLEHWPEGFGANTPKVTYPNPTTRKIEGFLTRNFTCRMLQYQEVLFIHEVEKLLQYVHYTEFSKVCVRRCEHELQLLTTLQRQVLDALFSRITRCIAHDNSVPIERVLQLWKNQHFNELCSHYSRNIIHRCLRPLLRGGKPFWNPTVNKVTTCTLVELVVPRSQHACYEL